MFPPPASKFFRSRLVIASRNIRPMQSREFPYPTFFPSLYSCASYCSSIPQDSRYHLMLFPPGIDWNDANHYTIMWFVM